MIVRTLLLLASVTLLGARMPTRPVDVAVTTSAGTFVVRLETAKAPRTTANFLRYVDAHRYNGASFYRTVRPVFGQPVPRIQVVQGGLEKTPGAKTFPPIAVEPTTRTGLHNVAGTLAMARTSDPNSATAEFFVNLADDRWLDADQFADHQGYAVFGRVVGGQAVVDTIHNAPASGDALTPPIRIISMRRL